MYKIKTSQRFENVVKFLRDSLGLRSSEGIFLYVNSTFAPGGDENVGNLWNVSFLHCFLYFDWGEGGLMRVSVVFSGG